MKSAFLRQNWIVLLAMLCAVVLISAPVYTYRILNPTDNDYGSHIQFAIDLIQHQPVSPHILAHPLIQVLLIGILWITRGKVDMWVGMITVLVTAQALTAIILYFWFGKLSGRWSDARRAFWAVTLTLVAPLMALAPLDGQYYFGYIGLANYHNPTIHLLRPIALASFLFAIRALEVPRSPLWMVLASAGLMVFSALAKPNYAVCVLPALGLLVGIHLLRRLPVDWRMVLGGFVLPAVLVLAVQGWVTYGEDASIILLPFGVEAMYSHYLPAKFFLSIVFPLGVLAVFFPQIWKDQGMLLAWATFAAGTLQMYLFAEGGNRLGDGNFRWGAQIGLFLLFAASARFLMRCTPVDLKSTIKRRVLVLFTYLPHVAAGVVYYLYAITSKSYR